MPSESELRTSEGIKIIGLSQKSENLLGLERNGIADSERRWSEFQYTAMTLLKEDSGIWPTTGGGYILALGPFQILRFHRDLGLEAIL